MKIFLTGANGFVGGHLYALLKSTGHDVRAPTRSPASQLGEDNVVCDLEKEHNFDAMLAGVDVIIHLAGRAHVMNESGADAAAAYRSANVEVTQRLAQSAIQNGVGRFIFLSSIKVNGESTLVSKPFLPHDQPNPQDEYGRSKQQAEHALRQIATGSKMDCVIIRTPLVYGAGVRANFASLVGLVLSGMPLPLAGVSNKRSLISVQNLSDVLLCAATNESSIAATLLVSDGEDLSTPQLIRAIAEAHNTPQRLFWFPPFLLRLSAFVLGKRALFLRLCGSLVVDIEETKKVLQWSPRFSVTESMRLMAGSSRENKS